MSNRHPKSIEGVSESYLCCNCGACKTVCPQSAIGFKTTSIGRMYASVDEKCIDCGLCRKVCPSLEIEDETKVYNDLMGTIESVSVGKASDQFIYRNAQSGGICTALLKYLFDSDKIDAALVCKMEYGTPTPEVRAEIISDAKDLASCQKSCYTPVELLSILKENHKKFNSIAVVGIGCQIEGLMRLQKVNKLIDSKIFCKIGLICDRSLCATIQDVYASLTPHFQAVKIVWRCKSLLRKDLHLQYKNAPLVIEDKNGEIKQFPNDYRFVLKNMFTSPRCRVCPNKLNLFSDITLGDPWNMSDIDWENGESVVVGRTELGENLIKEAVERGYMTLSPRPSAELYEGQLLGTRKIQISNYAKAFDALKPTIKSHLLNNVVSEETNKDEIRKANAEFLEFKDRESQSKNQIVKEARHILSKTNFRKSIIYRTLSKIYRILKRI